MRCYLLKLVLLSLWFLLACVIAAPIINGEAGLKLHNVSPDQMYVSGDWAQKDDTTAISHLGMKSLDRILPAGGTTFYQGIASASPKFFISSTSAALIHGDKRTHDTAVELTWNGFDGYSYYDVDVERGTSVSLWCHGALEPWESGQGCEGDVLADCPEAQRHRDGDGNYDQCLGESTPADIERRRRKCPTSYVESDDKRTNAMLLGHVLECWILDPKNASRTDSAQHQTKTRVDGMVEDHPAHVMIEDHGTIIDL